MRFGPLFGPLSPRERAGVRGRYTENVWHGAHVGASQYTYSMYTFSMKTHERDVARSRTLRKESTPQEKILWSKLRNNLLGVHFRRQHTVGPYVLDFFCHARNLAVEIDGSQHADRQEYDAKRTQYLADIHGITVIRFTNAEINTNIEGVLLELYAAVHSSG